MSQTHSPLPHVRPQGSAQQLIVDGQPFLMLAGEVHNSSSSSLAYMEPIWDRLAAMGLNTAIVPLYWELVEPEDEELPGLLAAMARRHQPGLIVVDRRHGRSADLSELARLIGMDPALCFRVLRLDQLLPVGGGGAAALY